MEGERGGREERKDSVHDREKAGRRCRAGGRRGPSFRNYQDPWPA